jgi:tetratricopeptide (TPR) repeat protein
MALFDRGSRRILTVLTASSGRRYVNLSSEAGQEYAARAYQEQMQGHDDRAVSLYRKELAFDSRQASWWYNLGIAYQQLGTGDRDTAEALRGGVEKTRKRVEQNLLPFLEGADIVEFVKHDGRLAEKKAAAPLTPLNLTQLMEKYLEAYRIGSMESDSLDTVRMHLRHFEKTLGGRFAIWNLTLADLQRHVGERSKKIYRGKPRSAVTLKKEMASLRAAWNWAVHMGLVTSSFPSKGLGYPKSDEKPPYMTRVEIERRIQIGRLSAPQIDELWECLYLRKEEIEQLLAYVKDHAAHPWVYPLFCAAAHTGARRSELLRLEVADIANSFFMAFSWVVEALREQGLGILLFNHLVASSTITLLSQMSWSIPTVTSASRHV